MKKTVLITGGSKGIGFELAQLFAKDNYDLVLISRNQSELQNAAHLLSNQFLTHIDLIEADLSDLNSIEKIDQALKKMDISPDILVNNAGFGLYGFFPSLDFKAQIDMINVNVTSLVGLSRLLLPAMIKRKSGGILNVASTAAFAPGPLMSVYYATKTFVLYFSHALREEVKDCGITVSVLCPGPTRTHFENRSNFGKTRLIKRKFLPMMTAQRVAQEGYNGFRKGKAVIVPGVLNKLSRVAAFITPMTIKKKVMAALNASD